MASRHQRILLLILFAALFVSCSMDKKPRQYKIGFSQCTTDDVWRKAMNIEMSIEASNYENLTILMEDAHDNNLQQIEQIRRLIDQKVDVLIISPNQTDAITPIAEEAYLAGIPTIIVDRKISSDNYTAFVGGDNFQIGCLAGQLASSLLPAGSTILEVWGARPTSPAQERHGGFLHSLDSSKNYKIYDIDGYWRPNSALGNLEQAVSQRKIDLSEIDMVYAHNDVMGMCVRDFIAQKDSSLLDHIKFLGVDGAFGEGAGLEAVANGDLTASFHYPTGGDLVIRIAMHILNGKKISKDYIMETTLIDQKTAQTLLMQSKQLISYQNKIENQRKNMNNIMERFSILKHSMAIIIVLLCLIIGFAIYIFFINKELSRRNKELKAKHLEAERQKEELVLLNEKIKQVNDQKIKFFMNVSHEIRTPLTLIISPLDKWLKTVAVTSPYYNDLLRMKRNSDRLLRVINQILDFRDVEKNGLVLKKSSKDIINFISSVKSTFDGLAENKNIHFTFNSDVNSYHFNGDYDKIEKILVNLLSNSFKFTPENGTIEVTFRHDEQHIYLAVQDNGAGIAAEKLPHIFKRFYTDSENNGTGSGIGLHLTKEFVSLHEGQIDVESEPGVKTTFTVSLPCDPVCDASQEQQISFDLQIPEINPDLYDNLVSKMYNYKILVVDDEPEIRDYLVEELSTTFKEVISAGDGVEALSILESSVGINLVLSDVLMPQMNGFELCQKIKSSATLSEISVILLTALTEADQNIYGIIEGADDYIQKPFNVDYLKVKIIELMKNRIASQRNFMRNFETGKIPLADAKKVITDRDHIFMDKFIAELEKSYADTDLSIDRLSEAMNVSRVHLYRKLKDITGITPVDYLRNFRLNKGVELLKSHAYSISEIAYHVGFSSPTYFSKCFKDVFNTTPSDFLESK